MPSLSEAVVHWIAYQRCLGIDRFLTESSLTIPVIGYLSSQNWETKKETDYGSLCKSFIKGKCFADFSFVRENEILILETKFFKSSSDGKVFNDMLRLALPVSPDLRRNALVVWSTDRPPWGQFDLLLNMKVEESIVLDPNNSLLIGADKNFPLSYNVAEFEKLRSYGANIGTIKIICSERIMSSGYGAALFSISR
jgi:hypothetical protein